MSRLTRREFRTLLRGLSGDAVFVHWWRKEPPEVEGHAAVSALIDRI